jgi:low affinity Fe/Cu permease
LRGLVAIVGLKDHGDDRYFVVNVGTTLKTHITRSLLQNMRVWSAAAVGTGS